MNKSDDFFIKLSIELLLLFVSFFLIFTAAISKKNTDGYSGRGVVSKLQFKEEYISKLDKKLNRKTKIRYKYTGILTKENGENVPCDIILNSISDKDQIKVKYCSDLNKSNQVIPLSKIEIDVFKQSFYLSFATGLLIIGICVFKRKFYRKLLIFGTTVTFTISFLIGFIRL